MFFRLTSQNKKYSAVIIFCTSRSGWLWTSKNRPSESLQAKRDSKSPWRNDHNCLFQALLARGLLHLWSTEKRQWNQCVCMTLFPFFGSIWNGSVLQVSRVKSAMFWPKVRKLTPDMAVTVQSETSLSGQLPPVRYQWRHTFSKALAVSCLEWFRDFFVSRALSIQADSDFFQSKIHKSLQVESHLCQSPIFFVWILDPVFFFVFCISPLQGVEVETSIVSRTPKHLTTPGVWSLVSTPYASSVTAPGGKTANLGPLKNGDNRQKWLVGMLLKPLFLNTTWCFFVRQSLFSFNQSAPKTNLGTQTPHTHTHTNRHPQKSSVSLADFVLKYHRENGGGPLKWY